MRVTLDAAALAPVLLPALGAVLLLVLDAALPRPGRWPWFLGGLVLAAGVAAAVRPLLPGGGQPHTLCLAATTCLYEVDRPAAALQVLALAGALVVLLLAAPVPAAPERTAVTVVLLLAATAGAAGVVAARDLGSWLVLLELASVPTVALVAFRARRSAVDSALTLLATALTSFALSAVGAALWLTATGSALLDGDAALEAMADPGRRQVLSVAVALLLAGVAFKLSLAPFHAWTPEALSGASLPVGGFLAVTSKVAALGALLAVVQATTVMDDGVLEAVGVAGLLSMGLGAVMALRERSTLRVLAWSAISQAGWTVLPLARLAPGAVAASAAYLVLIGTGTLAVFAALTLVAHAEGRDRVRRMDGLRGLLRRRPLAGTTLALGLLTLAGLPPAVAGLVAKVAVLRPVVTGEVWWLVVPAALNVVLGVAVYLRVLAAIAGPDDSPQAGERERAHPAHVVAVAACLLALVVLSLAPGLVLDPTL